MSAPRERRSRPAGNGPAGVEVADDDPLTIDDGCDLVAHLGAEAAWRDGYSAGFAAGQEVGAGRIVLGLEHVLGDGPGVLGTSLLEVAGRRFAERYAAERAEQHADSDRPCPLYGRPDERYMPPVHRCSTCSRYDARRENREQWGTDDFPPAEVRALVLLRQLVPEGAGAT